MKIRIASRWFSPAICLLIIVALLAPGVRAAWTPVGPFGGDVRSLVADPKDPDRMYLGTRTGQIYLTNDGGGSWKRLAAFHAPADWVVDSIVIDPVDCDILYAAMWSVSRETGGVYKSIDGGTSWRELEGLKDQSIRALTMAPSSSRILVAGSLQGVFRSDDAGATWVRISPPGHPEIRNVESVAIDPNRPEVIYVGTWHLPWKTVDGGAHWFSIKKGMVDDSDIFSILLDRSHPQTVYATACTGIYRSDSGGAEWKKIHGIPNSSRRTRILTIDPRDPRTVYAGTTQGLWRSKDGGASWARLTPRTWVINAIVIDGRDSGHIYLATDHSGVMESTDAGSNFQSANTGFAQRQISSVVADPVRPGRYYAALIHDGQFGAVMMTDDNGASWRATGPGLKGRDVFSLLLTTQPSWKLLAGTSDGILEFTLERPLWQSRSQVQLSPRAAPTPTRGISVWQLHRNNAGQQIYAATSAGLLESFDGRAWSRLPLDVSGASISAVATGGENGKVMIAATSAGLKISRDFGSTWQELRVESDNRFRATRIVSNPARANVFFIGGNTGLFRSMDAGMTWEKFGRGLPFSAIRGIAADAGYVIVSSSAGLFQSPDGGNHYTRLDGSDLDGLPIELMALQPSHSFRMLAATPYNGLFFYDSSVSRHQGAASAVKTPIP